MLHPMDRPPPSLAPRFAASMMPGPPPVMIANPSLASIRAVSYAALYSALFSGVRAEPKIVTALRMSERMSKPSTNSPMIRSTRQGSVLVKEARRSAGTTCGGVSSCSSSVSGLRGEALGCSDMVFLHVIEERRKPNVARPRVGDDAAGGQVPDAGGGKIGRAHV